MGVEVKTKIKSSGQEGCLWCGGSGVGLGLGMGSLPWHVGWWERLEKVQGWVWALFQVASCLAARPAGLLIFDLGGRSRARAGHSPRGYTIRKVGICIHRLPFGPSPLHLLSNRYNQPRNEFW